MGFLSKLFGKPSNDLAGFPSREAREVYAEARELIDSGRPDRPVQNFAARNAPALDRLPPAIGSATALEKFRIPGTAVSDLSPIASLKNIDTIDISGSRVTSLEPLASFHKLKSLNLANTQVTSLAPLAGLASLKDVNLAGTPVESLEPLVSLPQLTALSIARTQGIAPEELSRFPRLENVDFSETAFDSLEPIADMDNLWWLLASDTGIDSLEWVRNLRELEYLYIDNTKVSDLAPLAELKKLTSLSMDNTAVESIDILAGLTNLTRLSMVGTRVTNLRPLLKLPLGGDHDYDGVEFADCAACRDDPELARIAAITHSGKDRFARLRAYLEGSETTNIVEAGQHERSNVAMYLFDYDKMETSYGPQAKSAVVEALPILSGRSQLAEGDLEVVAGGVSGVPAFLQALRRGGAFRFDEWAIEPASTDSPLYALDSAAAIHAHAALIYFQESMYPPLVHERLRAQFPAIYLGCAVRELSARSLRDFEELAAELQLVPTGSIMGSALKSR